MSKLIRFLAFFIRRSRDPFQRYLQVLGPYNEWFFPCPPWEKVSVDIENGVGWQLRRHSGSSNLTFTCRGTDAVDDPQGTVDMSAYFDEWAHVTAVYDQESGLRSVYVNGLIDVADLGTDFLAACCAKKRRRRSFTVLYDEQDSTPIAWLLST